MAFRSDQSLNEWAAMLQSIYGGTQDYAKSPYELHAHLTEVCGVFGKFYFKKKDPEGALRFVPKMFAWASALGWKIGSSQFDLERLILKKFPAECPYCAGRPCTCHDSDKPTLNPDSVRRAFHQNAPKVGRAPNDFQMMFREIYGATWSHEGDAVRWIYLRLTEELAEVAEALRFHHLYPDNFENELADFFSWWFALVSSFPSKERSPILVEDLLWSAYPGFCRNCEMVPCYCRPAPVRELMSKPAPGQDHRFDALTATYNQRAYEDDLASIREGQLAVKIPYVCARVDVDDFRTVNTKYGHPAGDAALRHIAGVIQQKVRERDRVYRAGGDEFAVIFTDFTEDEAAGALARAIAALRNSPVRWVSALGDVVEFPVTVSIGVAVAENPADIVAVFEQADSAAYSSKTEGRDRITLASNM